MTLLAKSPGPNGRGLSLIAHTRQVVRAMAVIAARHAPTEQETARLGAVLHDLGKAHPFFQESLLPSFDRRRYTSEVPHRHEISSLLFLPLFPQEAWPALVEMVAGHHKAVQGWDDASQKIGRGLIDLVNEYGEKTVFARHAEHWAEWSPRANCILKAFGIGPRRLCEAETLAAFRLALDHCESRGRGWNRWRGLLMSADHFASAMRQETERRAERLYRAPDLSYYTDRAEKAPKDLYPLAAVSADQPQPHTLVIAPTGAGKTDYLLRRAGRAHGRVFYLLPFQASINAMFLRLDSDLNGRAPDRLPLEEQTDIRRVHAASRIEIEDGLEEKHVLQRHPGAAIKVMTPHQAASIVFGTSGHEAMALDLAGQDVILDEVHVYGDVAQAMVLEIVTTLVRLGCHVHIGSAIVPTELAKALIARLGGETQVCRVSLPDETLQTFDRHVVHKLATEEAARNVLREAVRNKRRILFLSNRVPAAQERFAWVGREFADVPSLLVHSRYRRCDRAAIEKKITEFDKKDGPCIVCATSVIEVSLDISFDLIVTDAAPLDSLIQRFGRVNRRRTTERTLCPVYVIAPADADGDLLPYSADVVRRSFAALPDGATLEETTLQARIDAIYPTVDLREISCHLVEHDGVPQIKELCHKPRCLLLDLLEIDSAVCVRASDKEEYRTARGDAAQRCARRALQRHDRPEPDVRPGAGRKLNVHRSHREAADRGGESP